MNTILHCTKPEQLFFNDVASTKKRFHELARQWHPDTNRDKDAGQVFSKINVLYEEALRKIEQNLWEGRATFKDAAFTFPYLTLKHFELGRTYIGADHVTFLVEPQHKALYDNALRVLSSFTYANDKMRSSFTKYLPVSYKTFKSGDLLGLHVAKQPDLLLLRDVLNHLTQLESKHVAWILSSLYNLCCYLSYTKIAHHDISPDTYFIGPISHDGALLGGWWYAKPLGDTVKQLPVRTYNNLPWSVRRDKRASPQTDLECIRLLGREALGSNTALKNVMAWLRGVAPESKDLGKAAVNEYKAYTAALLADGPKKYHKLIIGELYP